MGITYLPKRSYEEELRNGALKIVETLPAMPRVPFNATTLVDSTQPLADIAAVLAADTSDFAKII
jgi:hypothetical protein